MPRQAILVLLCVVLLSALAARWRSASWVSPQKLAPTAPQIEAAPMCPWRHPESDLRAFFPGATHHQTETRILSGARLDLTRRLRRAPTAEENSLYLHRVYHESHPLGTIMTRRVKGEYGAIEIVLAVDATGAVRGLTYQRLREPQRIADALRTPHWLGAFEGKTSDGDWTLGYDFPSVPEEASVSARAVLEGVRSLLILREVAEKRGLRATAPHHS